MPCAFGSLLPSPGRSGSGVAREHGSQPPANAVASSEPGMGRLFVLCMEDGGEVVPIEEKGTVRWCLHRPTDPCPMPHAAESSSPVPCHQNLLLYFKQQQDAVSGAEPVGVVILEHCRFRGAPGCVGSGCLVSK